MIVGLRRSFVIWVGMNLEIRLDGLEIRFKRIVSRKRPGDPETLKEFMEKEKMENIPVPANQQLENCLKMADMIIINDSTVEEFHKKISSVVEKK